MAQISLREYLNDIHQMIERERIPQAFAHIRHVMAHYPRNINAYRLLGRVLVQQRQWNDAEDIFRRLLGVMPNDVTAHFELSQIYQHMGKGERALWHIERAFDQAPNDETILQQLRNLYQEVRGNQLERVQLTAGAVAAQYLASDLNDQAVEVLRQALQRMPERTDLRLQLARALWRGGRQVDAAESAIEVLDKLPYALVANRILTELWLQEDRPSDAQRYLSRIEDVDPYLALRLATGQRTPDGAFMLEQLDYDNYTRHELATQNPDWLENIDADQATDATGAGDDFGDLDEDLLAELSGSDAGLDADEMLDDDDWLNELIDNADASTVASPRTKVTDELSDILPDDFALPDDMSDEREDLAFLDDIAPDADFLEDIDGGDEASDDMPSELMGRIDSLKGVADDETMLAKPTDFDDSEHASTGLTGMLDQADDDDLSWLSDLDDIDSSLLDDDPLATGQLDDEEKALKALASDEFADNSDETGERVSTGFTGMLDNYNPDDVGDTGEFEDVLDSFDPSELGATQDDETGERVSTGFTGMLDDYNPEDVSDTGQFEDVLDSFDPSELGATTDDDDVPDWLTGEENVNPPIQTFDDDDDALAWMKEAGIEIDAEGDADAVARFEPDEDPVSLGDSDEDPFAWMVDEGVELEDSALAEQLDAQAKSVSEQEDADPLAWMKDAGIEVDDNGEIIGDASDSTLGEMEGDVPDLFADMTDDLDTPEDMPTDDASANQFDWDDDESALDDLLALEGFDDDDTDDEFADELGDDFDQMDDGTTEAQQEGQALMNDDRDWQSDDAQDASQSEDDADDASQADDALAWLNDEEDMSWLNDSGELSDDFLSDESYDSMPAATGDPALGVSDDTDMTDDTDESLDFFAEFEDMPSDGLDDAFTEDGLEDGLETGMGDLFPDDVLMGVDDDANDDDGTDADDMDDADEGLAPADAGMLDWLSGVDDDELEADLQAAESTGFDFDADSFDAVFDENDAGMDDAEFFDGEDLDGDGVELEGSPLGDDFDEELGDDFAAELGDDFGAELGDDFDEELGDDFVAASADEGISESDLDWMVDADANLLDGDDYAEGYSDEFNTGFTDELSDEFTEDYGDDYAEDDVEGGASGMTGMLSQISASRDADEFDTRDDDFASDDEFATEDEGQPDWLNSYDGADWSEDADEQPEWLRETGEFTINEQADTGFDADSSDEFGDDFGDDEFAAQFDQTMTDSGDDEPDWLSQLGDFSEDDAEVGDFVEDMSDDVDEFDAQFDDEMPTIASKPMQNIDDQPDWLQDFAADAVDDIQVDDQPDWLQDMGSYDEDVAEDADATVVSADEFADEFSDEFEDEFEDEFSDEFEDEFEGDFADEFDETTPAELPDILSDESFYDEDDIDLAPADNAPDWLNAMVPGLDVDYEAEVDEADDVDYDDQRETLRDRQPTFRRITTEEFDWLVDLAAQEEREDYVPPASSAPTGAPVPPPPPPPLPMTPLMPGMGDGAGALVARFPFSEPPMWLRNLQAEEGEEGEEGFDEDFDDLDFDNEEFDDLDFDDDAFDDDDFDDLDFDDDFDD
jgi:Tfp pilus assembly protein PilF